MESNVLYRIGMPIERLSNVLAIYSCYEPYVKMGIGAAKTPGWVVVYLRDVTTASHIVRTIPEARVSEDTKPHNGFKV